MISLVCLPGEGEGKCEQEPLQSYNILKEDVEETDIYVYRHNIQRKIKECEQ